jgi:hypothetical protein
VEASNCLMTDLVFMGTASPFLQMHWFKQKPPREEPH